MIADSIVMFPGQTFVDVGACYGEELDRFLPMGVKMYSFEPHPEHFVKLMRRFGDDPGATLIEAAASTEDGTAWLYESNKYRDGSSLIQEKNNVGEKKFQVKTVRLADFIIGLGEVDALKIDAEGLEYELLEDLIKSGAHKLVKKFYIEDHADSFTSDEWHAKRENVLAMCDDEGVKLCQWD